MPVNHSGLNICQLAKSNRGRKMKLSNEHYLEKIGKANLSLAEEWYMDSEQFLFCVDWLEISAQDSRCDNLVEILEDYLDDMLAENIQQIINREDFSK